MAAKPFVPSSSTWLDPTMTTDHWRQRQLATVHTQPHQLMHNPSSRQLSALMQPTNHNYLAIRQTVSSNTLKTTHYDSRPLSKAYYKCMQSTTTAAFGRSNGLGMEGTPCAIGR
ncbi:hypothetical protein CPC08DRAFT_125824 [Agrocybe pediades]|nr:hypothetical protein CPC08DRAFT_125824 [Agrocybe pediades]